MSSITDQAAGTIIKSDSTGRTRSSTGKRSVQLIKRALTSPSGPVNSIDEAKNAHPLCNKKTAAVSSRSHSQLQPQFPSPV
jgi:hypothetical protein